VDRSELIAAVASSLFGATSIRTNGLETVANAALQRGIDAFMKKDYPKAVDEFKRSVGIGRNGAYAADAAQYMAMSYLQMNQPEDAVKAYQTALEIDRYRDDLRVKLGNLYFSQEKYEDARGQYAEAVRLNPSTVNRYSLGQAYIELGRYADAEDQYAEIQRISPEQAGGYLGMGLAYSRNGKHEEALRQYDEAIARDPELYDAYAQKGYAYAELGDMERAQEMVDYLESVDQADAADTLSRYMYKVDPPKMLFGMSTSSFLFSMGKSTPLVALNSYLSPPGASRTLAMTIQFDKKMDRASIENVANWQISRAAGAGPGESYNFGLRIPATEVRIGGTPESVAWDEDNLTATVYFKVRQNADANGTIDPSHIEFRFSGKDIYGLSMDPKADQFTGFKGVA
jgi:tetratricopeptide (TPR) repeat protein